MKSSPLRKATAAAVVLAIASCTTSATITRHDGTALEARIEHSTSRALDLSYHGGRPFRVNRSQVEQIDHPGTAYMMVGGLLSLFFVSALMSKQVHGGEFEAPERSYAIGTASLGLFSWGAYAYLRSKSASVAFDYGHSYIPAPPRLPSFAPLFPDAGAPPAPDGGPDGGAID